MLGGFLRSARRQYATDGRSVRRSSCPSLTAAFAVVILSACGSTSTAPTASASPSRNAPTTPAALPTDCTDTSPCRLAAGTYTAGPSSVLPGISITVPSGWTSSANDTGALHLIPPGYPKDALFILEDMTPVKSSGAGHGTTALTAVGSTPHALIAWLTSNPDVLIVAPPTPSTFGATIKATGVTVGVAQSVQYGDPACPANPRCADLFTRPFVWAKSEYLGLAGDEVMRLYVAPVTVDGAPHELLVVLDATSSADLGSLIATAQPVLDSLHLPAGVIAG